MAVTAPPQPVPPVDPQALIEEARRRARRRRRRLTALALSVVAGSVAGWLGLLHHAHRGGSAVAAAKPVPVIVTAHNGPLTVIESPGPGAVYVVDTHTGREKLIHRGVMGPHLQPMVTAWLDLAWSPDGSKLAFAAEDGPGGTTSIAVVHPDGSTYHVLRAGSQRHNRATTWSPDGRDLAYATGDTPNASVFTIRPDGTHRALVARRGAWPAWSPDGTEIAYLAPCGVRLITPSGHSLSGCLGVHGSPGWPPDGRQIAMQVAGHGIYVMNANGSNLKQLTTIVSTSLFTNNDRPRPSWAPQPR
jgi:Tol biopolymer transport system component